MDVSATGVLEYSDAELEQLLLDGESDLVGRKESLRGEAATAVREAVCAFANDLPDQRRPGLIFVGACDDALVALQQLMRNAVLHRSYEGTNAPVRVYWFNDRIEFLNPGGPYGNVTAQNFGEPGLTDHRNPNLAEAMRVLGLVQRFGAGLNIARRELAVNGNPPLEFDVSQTFVRVRVRPAY